VFDLRLANVDPVLLQALQFRWTFNVTAAWRQYYDALVAYKAKNRGRDPSSTCSITTDDGKVLNLGSWCKTQRKGKKKGTIDQERMRLLDEVNFLWHVNKAISWDEYYDFLLEYYQNYGNANPPLTLGAEVRSGRRFNLATWCDRMRRLRRKGELPDDQRVRGRTASFCVMYRPLSWS